MIDELKKILTKHEEQLLKAWIEFSKRPDGSDGSKDKYIRRVESINKKHFKKMRDYISTWKFIEDKK